MTCKAKGELHFQAQDHKNDRINMQVKHGKSV